MQCQAAPRSHPAVEPPGAKVGTCHFVLVMVLATFLGIRDRLESLVAIALLFSLSLLHGILPLRSGVALYFSAALFLASRLLHSWG